MNSDLTVKVQCENFFKFWLARSVTVKISNTAFNMHGDVSFAPERKMLNLMTLSSH